ncbi:MAG: amidohydrolase family protein [Chitinispirillaceae bacterium]|nr:amidohydrolase family protein [Chitinispirillaceae bacterium]
MPRSSENRTFIVDSDRSVTFSTGRKLVIIARYPRCICDSHGHIENGACVPLPLLWDKSRLIDEKPREKIDEMATEGIAGLAMKLFRGEAGTIQVQSTDSIGNLAVTQLDATFGPSGVIGASDLYEDTSLFTFFVAQMMDMEYACIAGFDGRTIYHDDESVWYYYLRTHGKNSDSMGKKALLPGENQKTFSCWKKQLDETITAMRNNPLRLFAMYHYDPRRWNFSSTCNYDDLLLKGPWNHPFNEIATVLRPGLFLGFKMYTPLGYKPLDERLLFLYDKTRDGDCFYARCEREKIPILVHCSPGGMPTHEMKFYMQFDGREPKLSVDEAMPEETKRRIVTPEGYFWNNYVHPRAWREVLVRFPELRLCLAHFGGTEWKRGLDSDWITEIIALTKEYPNVYTDFSCWDLDDCREEFGRVLTTKQYDHLKDKILFGTDWYMTLLALRGKTYKTFCEEFWDFFRELPDGMDLWERFTFINPVSFYGFFEKGNGAAGDKLDNISGALMKSECDLDKINEHYFAFRRLEKIYHQMKRKSGK